jgi:hypothetical protein
VSAEHVQARVSPKGFVAQRMPIDFNGHGHWFLPGVRNGELVVSALTDDEVKGWPALRLVEDPS